MEFAPTVRSYFASGNVIRVLSKNHVIVGRGTPSATQGMIKFLVFSEVDKVERENSRIFTDSKITKFILMFQCMREKYREKILRVPYMTTVNQTVISRDVYLGSVYHLQQRSAIKLNFCYLIENKN